MRYSTEPSDRIYIKHYGLLTFTKEIWAKIWAVNMDKGFLTVQQNRQRMHIKLLKKMAIQNTAEATGELLGNEIAKKIIKAASGY